MKLTEVFGEYTRKDFTGWLMSDEGKKHINEVFAPADTELNGVTAHDHKFGRCVWMAMQVLTRQASLEFIELLFENDSAFNRLGILYNSSNPGPETIQDFIREISSNLNRSHTLRWKDTDVDEVLRVSGLYPSTE